MKHNLYVTCFLIMFPALALAQVPNIENTGQGYVFVAPGAVVGQGHSTGFLHFGGGGEADLYKGLGMGIELGYLGPMQFLGDGVGLFSLNGLYQFKNRSSSKVVPFVAAGYSLVFRNGHANAVNFGVGTHYWFSRRVGLRLEFRDHVGPGYFSDHLLQGRVGISFR